MAIVPSDIKFSGSADDLVKARRALAALQAEQLRRRYLSDPVAWVHERLNGYVWSKQREIMEAVRDHRRVSVQSCHGVGKSFIAAEIACWWLSVHPPGEAFVVTTAPTGRQVKAILWRYIGRAHAQGKLAGRTTQTSWMMTMPAGNEEQVAFGQKPADIDPSAFQGIHARHVLVILDEACGIPETIWRAAGSLTSNKYSHILAIGNPDDPTSEFAKVCRPGSGWHVIRISAFDSPNFTGEPVPAEIAEELISKDYVEECLRDWGEDNPYYISKILGEFPEISADTLIQMKWIIEAQQRTLEPGNPHRLALDVGAGGDATTLGRRRGGVFRIIHEDHNPDTMNTCGTLLAYLRLDKPTKPEIALVDEIGIGKGVVDRAKEQNKPVEGVGFGSLPVDAADSDDGQSTFLNRRAEAYWNLRELFQLGEVDIDPADNALAAQLGNIRYKRTSQGGKILIESKEDMRRRGLKSPNRADCMALAFAPLGVSIKKNSATWGR